MSSDSVKLEVMKTKLMHMTDEADGWHQMSSRSRLQLLLYEKHWWFRLGKWLGVFQPLDYEE